MLRAPPALRAAVRTPSPPDSPLQTTQQDAQGGDVAVDKRFSAVRLREVSRAALDIKLDKLQAGCARKQCHIERIKKFPDGDEWVAEVLVSTPVLLRPQAAPQQQPQAVAESEARSIRVALAKSPALSKASGADRVAIRGALEQLRMDVARGEPAGGRAAGQGGEAAVPTRTLGSDSRGEGRTLTLHARSHDDLVRQMRGLRAGGPAGGSVVLRDVRGDGVAGPEGGIIATVHVATRASASTIDVGEALRDPSGFIQSLIGHTTHADGRGGSRDGDEDSDGAQPPTPSAQHQCAYELPGAVPEHIV